MENIELRLLETEIELRLLEIEMELDACEYDLALAIEDCKFDEAVKIEYEMMALEDELLNLKDIH